MAPNAEKRVTGRNMSAGNKVIELQLQMRQNAEDLQSYMSELQSWETDIKKRDEELRTGGLQQDQKSLPPVRNIDYKTKMRERKKKKKKKEPMSNGDAKAVESKDASRIKAYDYKSWDKFDVDQALSEMDKEESPAESNESDSESEADRDKMLAEKEKGNAFFKEGKATAFFRLNKYAVAESDCNLAIALDSNYFRAYARRGAARAALKKYECALEDYEMVLKLHPGNVEAQNEVKQITETLRHQAPAVLSEATQEAPEHQGGQEEGSRREEEEEQQKRQEAAVQKDRGNAYFKEGKYEAAVECYSRGMEADSLNVLLPANRAMALLKLERYKEAEEDCTKALSLDRTYTKAFARRATARVALGKLQEARQDFLEVLKLEPGNKQALTELQKLHTSAPPSGLLQTADGSHRRTVQPIDKPTHLQSAKPLRRIEIEEVSGEVTVSEGESEGSKLLIKEVMKEAEDDSSPLSTSPSAKVIKMEELADAPSLPESNLSVQKSFSPPRHGAEGRPNRQQEVAPPPPSAADLPPPPTNSFQLEADLRKLGQQPEVIYRYLRQVEPEAYASIFQNSLEPDILNQILSTLHGFYIKHEEASLTLRVLSTLASLRRFDMAIMFLSSPEKKVLNELFHFLHRAELEAPCVAALQRKYGV
ncbi:hypothetical protein CgunFtcFv8_009282 [Champsocephalus gunnari]|uniref:RNA polymerase II-associated protein 3 n=1 Tax=Champsocephalus gunnari TaxID=52237 RepID=A0AAN8C5P8_CHAGU|nr:hypothetical protein CgunFtcFv8_009282 [Champsocephalus gunnari]